jgi:hypothetical protein
VKNESRSSNNVVKQTEREVLVNGNNGSKGNGKVTK